MEHLQRITRALLDVAQAVESGTRPPRDLVRTAFASESAPDNEHPAWKQLLGDLYVKTDAASDPWPPHASQDEERRAVLAAAEPYLRGIRDLLASG